MSAPSIEALIAERVVERVRDELAPLRAMVEDVLRRLPPQLGGVDDVIRVTGMSRSTARRRIKDGSIPTVKVGRKVLVDLAALRPAEPAAIARLAREAREG